MIHGRLPAITGAVLALAAAAGLAAAPAAAQEDMGDVEIRTEHAGGNVHALFGRGGNIGVLTTENGIILIDDQFAPLTDKILDAIREIDDGEIRFVLNTHYHGDHTGGNANLGEAGATIVAHDNVRKRLVSDEEFPRDGLPVLTFDQALSFHLGEEARAHHVHNAHTDGDSFIHFKESNVIHAGDLVFNKRYPFIDVEAGGNLMGIIKGAKKIIEIADADTTIIPGHGPLADVADLKKYVAVLEQARERVSSLMEEGKSLEEIQQQRPMGEYDDEWGAHFIGPDRFLKLVHASLQNR